MDRMLDRIPGYGGYRDKERRRDSDRAIRDKLALEYGQLAGRLEAIATRLADERQIMLIGTVDKPLSQLRLFIDRVNTAAYGYAPLFQDNAVDDAALDQVAAFDQSLADQQAVLAGQIGELEGADPASPDFKRIAGEISKTVAGLSLRFDKRNEVIHGGTAIADANVLALLDKPGATAEPPAYRLHQNEAVSYGGVNYTVAGRVSVATPEGAWRLFQLTGGSNDQWLQAPAAANGPYGWYRRVELGGAAGAQSVQAGGASYTLAGSSQGSAEVVGRQGASGDRPVALEHYRYASSGGGGGGAEELHAYVFGSDMLALLGTRIEVNDIDVYSREQ